MKFYWLDSSVNDNAKKVVISFVVDPLAVDNSELFLSSFQHNIQSNLPFLDISAVAQSFVSVIKPFVESRGYTVSLSN